MDSWKEIFGRTFADSAEHKAAMYEMPTSPLDSYRTDRNSYPTAESTQQEVQDFYAKRADKRESIAKASGSTPVLYGNKSDLWNSLSKTPSARGKPQQYPAGTPAPLRVRQNANGMVSPETPNLDEEKALAGDTTTMNQMYRNRFAELSGVQQKIIDKPSNYSFGGNVGASGTQSYVFGGARFNVVNPLGDLLASVKEYNKFEQQRRMAHLEEIRQEKVGILNNIDEAEKNSLEVAKLQLEVDKENNDREESLRDFNEGVRATNVDNDLKRVGLFIDNKEADIQNKKVDSDIRVDQQNANTSETKVSNDYERRGEEIESLGTYRGLLIKEGKRKTDESTRHNKATEEIGKNRNTNEATAETNRSSERITAEANRHTEKTSAETNRHNERTTAEANRAAEKAIDEANRKAREVAEQKRYDNEFKYRSTQDLIDSLIKKDRVDIQERNLDLATKRFEQSKKFFDQINPVKLTLLNNQLKSSKLDAQAKLATIRLAFENVGAGRSFDELIGEDPVKVIEDLDLYVNVSGEQPVSTRAPVIEEQPVEEVEEESTSIFDWFSR